MGATQLEGKCILCTVFDILIEELPPLNSSTSTISWCIDQHKLSWIAHAVEVQCLCASLEIKMIY